MSRDALVDLLQWYGDVGVDIAVDEQPHDRFAEAELAAVAAAATAVAPVVVEAPTASRPASPGVAAPAAVRLSADQSLQSAREHAAAATTLDELRSALEHFDGCSLKITATQLVFADGRPGADVMLIGGAPDDDEDRGGRPFAGRAGVLLDRMLAAIGLDRTTAYLAPVVPWRPPGNRAPSIAEITVCLPFIRRHIELAAPRLLVCFGDLPAGALLGRKGGIGRLRGQWLEYLIEGGSHGPRTVGTMPTLHPNHLLRVPTHKRLAWRDLQAVAKARAALHGAVPG